MAAEAGRCSPVRRVRILPGVGWRGREGPAGGRFVIWREGPHPGPGVGWRGRDAGGGFVTV